jgi:enoyl-[acyl-carrier protein] reductase I
MPCELTDEAQVQTVFAHIQKEFGQLNYLIHCIAYADRADLQGAFRDVSRQGFHTAMEISAYTLVAVARHAAPLMPAEASSMVTLTYMASERVVPITTSWRLKAALENSVRYLANDLGPYSIHVNAISAVRCVPPRRGRSVVYRHAQAARRTRPLRRNITVEEVGKRPSTCVVIRRAASLGQYTLSTPATIF